MSKDPCPTENRPVPLAAKGAGFFHRLLKVTNSPSIRLEGRHQDPHSLEIFITATTSKWSCWKNESTQLHCFECPMTQQRECAIWALSRTHRIWYRWYLTNRSLIQSTNWAIRKSRTALLVIWLRLLRVYRIPLFDVKEESKAIAHKIPWRGNTVG